MTNYPFYKIGGRVYALAQVNLCTLCGCPPPHHGVPGCENPAGQTSVFAPFLIRHIGMGGVPGPIYWLTTNKKDLLTLNSTDVLAYNASLLSAADAQTAAAARHWYSHRFDLTTPDDSTTVGQHLNERSAYVRQPPSGQPPIQLQLLIRSGTVPFVLWSSSCDLFQSNVTIRTRSKTTSDDAAAVLHGLAPGSCPWTIPVPSTIPDSHTEMHTGLLPDGRVYLLGTQVPNTTARHRRDPLTLSLSSDGLAFDKAWALRYDSPPMRYPTAPGGYENGKNYGFQYPDSAVLGESLWVVYSTNKEDIELMKVPISMLHEH